MIDWTKVVGFDRYAGNERKSSDKHCVLQGEAEQTFFGEPLLILEDELCSSEETRFHALGRTAEGRRLHITFALRLDGALIHIISARDRSAKEKKAYEQNA